MTTRSAVGAQWLEWPFLFVNPDATALQKHRQQHYRQGCGLVWDIWAIALGIEGVDRKGQSWSVFHLPTGLGVGTFSDRQTAMLFVERITALGNWDSIGLPYCYQEPGMRLEAQRIRAELGGV